MFFRADLATPIIEVVGGPAALIRVLPGDNSGS